MNRSTRLIVFDLDGTLVDSRRDIAESANALLVACGGRPLPEDTIGRMVGEGAATLIARAFAASGLEPPARALDEFLRIYDARLVNHTRPYPGMVEVLSELHGRGPLAVLTNKPLAATRRVLAGLDLWHFFPDDRIVGGDGPFPRKPEPSGLQHLIAAAGTTPGQTTLVGDSVIDLRTARNAAARVCLVRYGFGFEAVPLAELEPGEHVVDSPAELLCAL